MPARLFQYHSCVSAFSPFSSLTLFHAVGVALSSSDELTTVLLLTGQYVSMMNAQLLHNILASKSASLIPPLPGFNSSESLDLSLDLALETCMAIYPGSLYFGAAAFTSLPSSPTSNSSTTLLAASLALSSTVWAAVDIGNEHVVLWDSVPDAGQSPFS